ncbi:MAG: FAD-dependent oxidoreductase [Candidatus Scatomorpha sp.]|jgi:2,4-dienoyl-CoA reductase-like NADH-dependent reductase (Old Yellow Enzyme family)
MNQYKLLTSIQAGPLTIKNRIMYLGMGKMLSTPDNFVTERQIAYYENLAKNNVGLIATGACIVFEDYASKLPCQPGLYDDKFIPGLSKLAEAVHRYGAKMLLQAWHPGLARYGCAPDAPVKAPADFTVDEIHDMQNRFVEAIVRIQKAGFDGVEWHAAHNYMMEEFMVPYFNKRTDEYGADTVDNAARFSEEVISRVRAACGDGFFINVKINAWDMGVEGGMTPEWCAEICRRLEKAGANMFSVSAGGGLTDITGMSGDGYRMEGWKIDFAKTVKDAVSVPVMATGSIRHVRVMEEALRDGKCDMFGLGRGLLADPELVTKIEQGRENEIRYCLSCLSCFDPYYPNKKHCSLNPNATYEFEEKIPVKDGGGRTVVVVGAGPAGVNAAMILAEREFKPIILEKTSRIGGSIHYAATPDGKAKLNWAIPYYQAELERLGIEVRLDTEATAESVLAFNPYAVFLANGAEPVFPSRIPGIDGGNVIQAKKLLDNVPALTDSNVTVIGGGMVGLEIATTFSHMGCSATVVEMQDAAIMPKTMTYRVSLEHAQKAGCHLLFGHKLDSVTPTSVTAENSAGEKIEILSDLVVLCMGFRPDNGMYDALREKIDRVYRIGDADTVDNIANAARNGYASAMELK